MSLAELISENKRQLLNDKKAMERLEDRIDSRHIDKAEQEWQDFPSIKWLFDKHPNF